MDYSVETSGQTTTLILGGQFTSKDRREFDDVIKSIVEKDGSTVEVNMASLSYLDSVGLGMLITLRAEVEMAEKSIALISPRGDVKDALYMSCFDRLFDIK